ncbi:MAG: hypothetical protein GY804_10265 [Alphaproteobacteria bacterium]|nr:hypothetical protein [Alphaproteobacteria bacterium]
MNKLESDFKILEAFLKTEEALKEGRIVFREITADKLKALFSDATLEESVTYIQARQDHKWLKEYSLGLLGKALEGVEHIGKFPCGIVEAIVSQSEAEDNLIKFSISEDEYPDGNVEESGVLLLLPPPDVVMPYFEERYGKSR